MVHRLTPEYGQRVFGQDYGAHLMQWVTANYTLDRQLGELPTADRPSFFILLLRRNP
jgi:hypothetical protein